FQPRLDLLPLPLKAAERHPQEPVTADLVGGDHAGRGPLAAADPPRYWRPRTARERQPKQVDVPLDLRAPVETRHRHLHAAAGSRWTCTTASSPNRSRAS